MMKALLIPVVSAGLLFAQGAFAGADCPAAPKEQWMSPMEMQKKIINEYGLSIEKFKVDGNCYEIYGRNDEGRVEVYFNPVDGSIVKQKKKD
jgi:hypothetical protein